MSNSNKTYVGDETYIPVIIKTLLEDNVNYETNHYDAEVPIIIRRLERITDKLQEAVPDGTIHAASVRSRCQSIAKWFLEEKLSPSQLCENGILPESVVETLLNKGYFTIPGYEGMLVVPEVKSAAKKGAGKRDKLQSLKGIASSIEW